MTTAQPIAAPSKRIPALLDRSEQVIILALFVWLVWRVIVSDNPFAPLVIVGEIAVLAFVLLRRPSSNISMRGADWAIAFAATFLPLLFDPAPENEFRFSAACVLLFVIGTTWQLWAKLVLRRSFGIIPANRGVKSTGPYTVLRHPMYFGYLLGQISILLLMFSPWNLALYASAWMLQLVRLKREEDLLMQDPAYREYAKQVPYRLIPRIY